MELTLRELEDVVQELRKYKNRVKELKEQLVSLENESEK
mgnify:CR=1 FL=1